jgi:phosphopantetheine adenylyltransferase
MTTKKQTVNFNKFFPDDNAFVTLKGAFNPLADSIFDDEFDLDLTIQTATNRSVNLYSWMTSNDETLKQLKAIHEATGKAIEFYETVAKAKKESKPKAKPIDFAPKRVLKTRK